MQFIVKHDQKIVNLMADASGEVTKTSVVVTEREETTTETREYGAAKVGDHWYKVVSVGGVWQAAWSDRQQKFVTIEDEVFLDCLEKCVLAWS